MYGGCALSMERSEVPPKTAADSRVGWRAFVTRAAASGGRRGCGGACGVRVRIEPGGAIAVVDVEARWRRGVLRCRCPPPSCALALRGRVGGAGLRALGRFGAVPGGVFRGLPRHEGGAVIAGGSHCSAAQRLRALGWFADAGWQDLRAVHDSRCPCSEKGPFLARYSRGVSSNGDLRGFSDAWRAHLAKASPFSDAWRANLATNWRFSRPRPLSGCMERKTCHGLTPGNAPRENIATVGCRRAHLACILPSSSARERIKA